MSFGFTANNETCKKVTHLSHPFEISHEDVTKRMADFINEREDGFAQSMVK